MLRPAGGPRLAAARTPVGARERATRLLHAPRPGAQRSGPARRALRQQPPPATHAARGVSRASVATDAAATQPAAPLAAAGGDLVAWREWELATAGAQADLSWPSPLTPEERIKRSLAFWSRVGPVILRYQFLQLTAAFKDAAAAERAWEALHEEGSDVVFSAISDLRGFYTKTGQLIGSRPDLFPLPYTRKLAPLQDSVPAMDGALLVRVVETELLGGRPLSSVFSAFDAEPLGSASVAQVHRAVLLDGRVVAVKVQRPSIEPLMLGDVANVKALAFQLRGRFPVDYYTVFSELEAQLAFEFDFKREAASLTRVADTLAALTGGAPVRIPRPVAGLVAKRVLVMDFIAGTPLSRLAAAAASRSGIAASALTKVVGTRLLRSLSDAFGAMMLGDGFFHGDPHPGNIMLNERDGSVALIDFGQVKQLKEETRLGLARIMLLLDACGGGAAAPGCAADLAPFAEAVEAMGVVFKPGVKDRTVAAAALAFWLFDSTAAELPGGYDAGELSPGSPVAEVASFPQELVFVGRSTVLIRGLAARLGVPWSLAREWAPAARAALAPPEQAAAAVAPPRRRLLALLLAPLAALARWLAALRAALGALFRPAVKQARAG